MDAAGATKTLTKIVVLELVDAVGATKTEVIGEKKPRMGRKTKILRRQM